MKNDAKQKAIKLAMMCKTRNEFKLKYNSSYQYILKNKLQNEAFSHMDKYEKYSESQIIEDAKKYNTRYEWQRKSNFYYSAKYKGVDFLNKCCEHMDIRKKKYTKEEVILIAKQYKTRKEFEQNNMNAYCFCIRSKIIDEVCQHMENQHTSWNCEKIKDIAIKYNSKVDFSSIDKNAYNAARRLGLLNDVCSHMQPKKSTFDYSKPCVMYYISIDNGLYYEIGITSSSVKKRFSSEKQNRFKIIFQKKYERGIDAKKEEQRIKKEYKKYRVKNKVIHSGNTEVFTYDILGLDLSFV